MKVEVRVPLIFRVKGVLFFTFFLTFFAVSVSRLCLRTSGTLSCRLFARRLQVLAPS
jgi:hypothetical protein